ncbi:MAG: uridine kinase [Deltaproteobacteria bacterium CG2_30_63_29]|nr:MAG: uridine kinase [Deltaproteobacteria bacterium CG2_30_63_29]PJB34558.1 MAG: uridine kinase [Deltaproteobacteria bacterium CG_4_9_14_3_um_filter_63_12]
MRAPVIVGVAGGTGSGKTTLAKKVCEGVGSGASLVQHDWYYKNQSMLTREELAMVNFDHPDALDNELLIRQLEALKRGEAIQAPIYDFKTHARAVETLEIKPNKVIVVEGILLFAIDELRDLFDIKLFVDTDADIRVFRRVRRDIRERGRDFESIRRQYYETVRPMHLRYVEPSKRTADLIIPEGGQNRIALEMIIERFKNFLD